MLPEEAFASLNLTTLLVLALCVYRVTKLIVDDTIADPPRNWVFTHAPEKVVELVQCPWCSSFWVGMGATVSYLLWPETTVLLALPWALSAVAGLLTVADG